MALSNITFLLTTNELQTCLSLRHTASVPRRLFQIRQQCHQLLLPSSKLNCLLGSHRPFSRGCRLSNLFETSNPAKPLVGFKTEFFRRLNWLFAIAICWTVGCAGCHLVVLFVSQTITRVLQKTPSFILSQNPLYIHNSCKLTEHLLLNLPGFWISKWVPS